MARFSIRNLFRNSRSTAAEDQQRPSSSTVIVGADDTVGETLSAYDNSTITYSSDLSSVSYDDLLRDKQANIVDLYRLADYYTDADAIVHGIIKGVYVPFSATEWYLTGENQKTIQIFKDYYKAIRIDEHIADIFTQYYKYGNVFIYIWKGNIMTLPPHKCKIGNMSITGTPVVDFNVQDISTEFRQRTYSVLEQKGLDDDSLDKILEGYPPEVADAIKKGNQYAQFDPNNCFVLQANKEGWTRYAVPWIACALPALAKKELISKYETALLNLGQRSFVHVKYGDSTKGKEMYPDRAQLSAVRTIFSSAMNGKPLAVTNHLAEANVVQADLSDLYQFPIYDQVNADILAAGGVAGIIVNGRSEDGSTFASAQVSMQAAAARIEAARREVEDLMKKVNARLVEDIKLVKTNNLKSIPEFHFMPMDMTGKKALLEACESLWNNGLVSTKTYMNRMGYSLENEKAQRETEASDGTDEIMIPRDQTASTPSDSKSADDSNKEKKVGRPKMDDTERNSDPENAIRSKQAKDAENGDMNSE